MIAASTQTEDIRGGILFVVVFGLGIGFLWLITRNATIYPPQKKRGRKTS